MSAKQTLYYSIIIDAPRKIVWDCMLNQDTYRLWTAPFMEGSYYEGSWDKGARIHFLGPDGSGMAAEIAANRPHEYISIRHLGFLQNGVEDLDSENVKSWAPAYENYTLADTGPFTEVKVDIEMTPDFVAMMNDKWPRALERLKEICEARTGKAIG